MGKFRDMNGHKIIPLCKLDDDPNHAFAPTLRQVNESLSTKNGFGWVPLAFAFRCRSCLASPDPTRWDWVSRTACWVALGWGSGRLVDLQGGGLLKILLIVLSRCVLCLSVAVHTIRIIETRRIQRLI